MIVDMTCASMERSLDAGALQDETTEMAETSCTVGYITISWQTPSNDWTVEYATVGPRPDLMTADIACSYVACGGAQYQYQCSVD